MKNKKNTKMRVVRIQWHKIEKSFCVVARLHGFSRHDVNCELAYSFTSVIRGVVYHILSIDGTDMLAENFRHNCLKKVK